MPRQRLDKSISRSVVWRLSLGIGLVVALVTVVGLRTYRSIEQDLTSAALSGRSSISYLAAATLTEEFQRFIDLGKSLATRVQFGRMAATGEWDRAIQIMYSVPRDFEFVEQVLIADPRGKLQAVYPDIRNEVGADLSNRDWFTGVSTNWQPYVSSIYSRDDDRPHRDMALAMPMLSETGTPVAILVLRARLDRFFDWTRGLKLDPDGSIFIVDRKGQIAFDSSEAEQTAIVSLADLPAVRRVLAGEAGVQVQDPKSVDARVIAYSPSEFGWGIVTHWPHDTVFAARDEELQRVAVTSLLILMLALITLYAVMRAAQETRESDLHRQAAVDLERRVAERTTELQRSNEELESFSYSISHDLRAPLRSIDGFSAMLDQEYAGRLDTEGRRFIANIRRNIVRMSHLIDDLLDFARLRHVQLDARPVDMNALVAELLGNENSARTKPAIHVEQLPPTHGDAALLRQVWSNLIDNAMKYSSQVAQPDISITGSVVANEAQYCVADNGIGFDMDRYERLFKPFSRLHRAEEFSGTGVGLAIVRRIVEHHGGRVWADSKPGVGTKVYFTLPASPS